MDRDAMLSLLAEHKELRKIGERIQQQRPSAFSQRELDEFRHRYRRWYDRALPVMHPSLRDDFERQYEGTSTRTAIRAFLAEPVARRDDRGGGLLPDEDGHFYWKRPLLRDFAAQFALQGALVKDSYFLTMVENPVSGQQLHPAVQESSGRLLRDGHYRQAIFDACLALIAAVQAKSGRHDLDGAALMQQVFAPKNPLIRFDGHNDEQQGFMWLFSGVVMAVRNPRGHQLVNEGSLDETMEILGMISMLFRALDRAKV